MYVCMYVYIERERERESAFPTPELPELFRQGFDRYRGAGVRTLAGADANR